jgi:hypothetical protein
MLEIDSIKILIYYIPKFSNLLKTLGFFIFIKKGGKYNGNRKKYKYKNLE